MQNAEIALLATQIKQELENARDKNKVDFIVNAIDKLTTANTKQEIAQLLKLIESYELPKASIEKLTKCIYKAIGMCTNEAIGFIKTKQISSYLDSALLIGELLISNNYCHVIANYCMQVQSIYNMHYNQLQAILIKNIHSNEYKAILVLSCILGNVDLSTEWCDAAIECIKLMACSQFQERLSQIAETDEIGLMLFIKKVITYSNAYTFLKSTIKSASELWPIYILKLLAKCNYIECAKTIIELGILTQLIAIAFNPSDANYSYSWDILSLVSYFYPLYKLLHEVLY